MGALGYCLPYFLIFLFCFVPDFFPFFPLFSLHFFLSKKIQLGKFQAEKISHEFLAQYKQELETGLVPTGMWASLDKNFNVGMYDSQVKFIQFIVQPMWNLIVDIFPEFNSEGDLMGALKTNRETWARMHEEESAKLAAAADVEEHGEKKQ